MNLYSYIAANNPSMAKAICHKYGYNIVNVRTANDLGLCLEKLVAAEGEHAFADIVNNHPDKEVILEVCAPKKEHHSFEGVSVQSGCSHSCNCSHCQKANFVNFTGDEQRQKSVNASQTNAFIMASALLLAVAIIATHK